VARKGALLDAAKKIQFGGQANYRSWTGGGLKSKADLDAFFSVSWTPEKLFLKVVVSDDVFSQEFQGAAAWNGDSLQIAFQPLTAKGVEADVHFDFDAYLGKDGVSVIQQSPEAGIAKGCLAKVVRNGSITSYELELAPEALGLKSFAAGSTLGFAALVNDNDGSVRKGCLRWGDGIGQGKDPASYNWLYLED
jgi:hypothetical protein